MAKGYKKDGTPLVPPTKKSKGESGALSVKMHLAPLSAVRAQKNQVRYIEWLVIKDQLTGLFTQRELTGIIDAMNGVMVEYPLFLPARDMLIAQVEDACTLEANDKRFRYGVGELLVKLRNLTDVQADCLLLALVWFWERKICKGDLTVFLNSFGQREIPGV